MNAGTSIARQARNRHRHELRTLVYVTLDQANGGVVRNLTHDGMGAQVVAAVRPRQILRVRFELRYPRLRIETRGEVMWATFSGQCGIRFLDLSPRLSRQIDEWIFGNLIEGAELHEQSLRSSGPLLATPVLTATPALTATPIVRGPATDVENDGLRVSGTAVKVIELPLTGEPTTIRSQEKEVTTPASRIHELDWLSRPLSGRGLAWTVNSLVIVAGLLLFALVFLFVTREPPKWPMPMALGAAVSVAALYWGFFRFFGGASPGERLARLGGYSFESEVALDARAGDYDRDSLSSN